MAAAEIDKWVEDNKQQLSFAEHVSGIPSFIKDHSAGYLQAVAGLFVAFFFGQSGADKTNKQMNSNQRIELTPGTALCRSADSSVADAVHAQR